MHELFVFLFFLFAFLFTVLPFSLSPCCLFCSILCLAKLASELSIYLSYNRSIYPSVCVSTYRSIYLPVCPSIYFSRATHLPRNLYFTLRKRCACHKISTWPRESAAPATRPAPDLVKVKCPRALRLTWQKRAAAKPARDSLRVRASEICVRALPKCYKGGLPATQPFGMHSLFLRTISVSVAREFLLTFFDNHLQTCRFLP